MLSNKEFTKSKEMPIVPVNEMEYLIGRVMTILDVASANEPTKSLIRQELWMWYENLLGYTTIFEKFPQKPNEARSPIRADEITH